MLNAQVIEETCPRIGWYIDDKLISPPAAYITIRDWLVDFENSFPEKAKKMQEYSQKHGWSEQAHAEYWFPVILLWLQKK